MAGLADYLSENYGQAPKKKRSKRTRESARHELPQEQLATQPQSAPLAPPKPEPEPEIKADRVEQEQDEIPKEDADPMAGFIDVHPEEEIPKDLADSMASSGLVDAVPDTLKARNDPMAQYTTEPVNPRPTPKSPRGIPLYQDRSFENRFGITAGYKWDGVDRSNGFERKVLESYSRST